MTGWLLLIALVALTAIGLWRLGRVPPAAVELLGAAALIAIAGYVWQGSPALPGKPTSPAGSTSAPADRALLAAIVAGRVDDREAVLSAADRMIASGATQEAATAIQATLDRHPGDPDLWVGLGNALVAHNNGVVTPAARLAFAHAATLAPGHPGPAFFAGLAYAQSGQVEAARREWRRLLARTPPGAPWREDLEQKLRSLDAR
ncbi:tetratricopeptide repeat protein [Sphingomonas adhaesiva]|uniref:tetratricopeptide repeat protein n=1 Tax=Sphingomonas adhaesiva TaxID=28212 RepID=UPI002FF6581F